MSDDGPAGEGRTETRTPAFARWALARACDYRQEAADPFDPVAVERELRPLQEASQAIAEGRIARAFAIAPDDWRRMRSKERVEIVVPEDVLAFSVDEILAYYGGEESADATCGGCPANVGEAIGSRWAGCFGLVMSSQNMLSEALDAIAESSGAATILDATFPRTTPRWHGWWIDAAWSENQVRAFLAALDVVTGDAPSLASSLVGADELRAALRRVCEAGLGFRTTAFPPGRIEGRSWYVDAHCPRCKAPAEAGAKFCRVCRRAGGMFPSRTRKARGERPYRELGKLLSKERAAEVIQAIVEAGNRD